jgi:hypothetical protein
VRYLDQLPDPLIPAASIVGPVEPWDPNQGTPGPARNPGGRSGTNHEVPPDPVRPPGTEVVPCDKCEGSDTRLLERQNVPAVSTPCVPCEGSGQIEVVWRTAAQDGLKHVFRVGGVVAEALCTNCFPHDTVTDDLAVFGACLPCTFRLAELAQLARQHTQG